MNENYFNNVDDFLENWEEIDDEVFLKLSWKGKFGDEIFTEVNICGDYDENKDELKNTLAYISNNFEKIYFNMLSAILPVVKQWGMANKNTNEKVLTLEDLNSAKLPQNYIEAIQINCSDKKKEQAYYSIIFRIDYNLYGYDDGMEVVLFGDNVVFWSDGNTREYLFEFREHKGEITYFGEKNL